MILCRIIKKLIKIKNVNKRYKSEIREIDYDNLKELINNEEEVFIIDIRSPQEYAEKRIKYAINIPIYELNKKINKIVPNMDSEIILYCGCRNKK